MKSGSCCARAVIGKLHETWRPVLEALRQRIDLDRLDPLDAIAQVALGAEIERLRRSLGAKDRSDGDQLDRVELRERIRRWRERIWLAGSNTKPRAEP